MLLSISSNNADSTLELLSGIVSEWTTAIRKMFELIKNDLSNRYPINVSDITQRQMIAEGELAAVDENIKNVKGQIVSKRQTLLKLRENILLIQQMQMNLLST